MSSPFQKTFMGKNPVKAASELTPESVVLKPKVKPKAKSDTVMLDPSDNTPASPNTNVVALTPGAGQGGRDHEAELAASESISAEGQGGRDWEADSPFQGAYDSPVGKPNYKGAAMAKGLGDIANTLMKGKLGQKTKKEKTAEFKKGTKKVTDALDETTSIKYNFEPKYITSN